MYADYAKLLAVEYCPSNPPAKRNKSSSVIQGISFRMNCSYSNNVLTESYEGASSKMRQHKSFGNVTADHLEDIMVSPLLQGKSLKQISTGHISSAMHAGWSKFGISKALISDRVTYFCNYQIGKAMKSVSSDLTINCSCRKFSLKQEEFFTDAGDGVGLTADDVASQECENLERLSAKEAWETIDDCVQYDKQWKNLTSTISDQTIANLKAQLVENEVVRVMIPKCMSWLDAFDKPIGDIEDKEDNPSPQSASQVLPSIELYTPPVTYPKEVDETIRIPIEVEPLDQTKLEDLDLNAFNHDIPLSSWGIPSVDEPKP
ncbi:hypothetical protein Tco_0014484 [Tanacetum coccineum]